MLFQYRNVFMVLSEILSKYIYHPATQSLLKSLLKPWLKKGEGLQADYAAANPGDAIVGSWIWNAHTNAC